MIEESGEFLLELHIEQSRTAEVILDLRGRGFAESVRSSRAPSDSRRERGIRPRRTARAVHVVLVPPASRRRRHCWRMRASRRSSGSARSSSTTAGRRRMPRAATGRAATGQVERRQDPRPARTRARRSKRSGCGRCGGSGPRSSGIGRRRSGTSGSRWRTRRPGLDAAVLDPRSPAARRVLVDRLRALLADTGAHGFKLDFLERFAQDGGPPLRRTTDAASIEDGALRLLDEIAALGSRSRS